MGTFPFSSDATNTSCGFPLLIHLEGTVHYIAVDTAHARFFRRTSLTATFTNLSNGHAVSGTDHRAVTRVFDLTPPTVNPDGTITFHDEFRGLFSSFVVPGLGAVAQSAGRFHFDVVVDAAGNITEAAFFLDAGVERLIDAKICQALK
jgi:hypothetical protein